MRFHRQRLWKTGWSRMACCSVARIEPEVRKRGTSASGKLWWGPREMTIASSLALAWSSKLNPAQNFFRRSVHPSRGVEPTAVRRVHHELHPARLVEEPLDHQVVLGRHDAEDGRARGQVGDDGGGRVALDPSQVDDLVHRSGQIVVDHSAVHHRSDAGDLLAQLHRAGGGFAAARRGSSGACHQRRPPGPRRR